MLDYFNALLAGPPEVLQIQKVINCSAGLICKAPSTAYITLLVFDHHWLPISSRIQYKIALICFHLVSGTAPPYLSELFHLYSLSLSLRSASDIPCSSGGQEDPGGQILSMHRTVIWNSLPLSARRRLHFFF